MYPLALLPRAQHPRPLFMGAVSAAQADMVKVSLMNLRSPSAHDLKTSNE